MSDWRVLFHLDFRLYIDVAALKIHMSKNAYDALNVFPDFITECRGKIFIKVRLHFVIKTLQRYVFFQTL